VGRTQQGNNNAYCHDRELTWFDWGLVDENGELLRFVRHLIDLRSNHSVLRGRHHPHGVDVSGIGYPDLSWHGTSAWQPSWEPYSRLLAFMRSGSSPEDGNDHVYVAVNAHWEPHDLQLPGLPDGVLWHTFADTAAAAPGDVYAPGEEPVLVNQQSATIGARGALVLVARRPLY
jgi:glycogen operon protein